MSAKQENAVRMPMKLDDFRILLIRRKSTVTGIANAAGCSPTFVYRTVTHGPPAAVDPESKTAKLLAVLAEQLGLEREVAA